MEKTESYVRRVIQDNMDDITSVVKKSVAGKLRDKILSDMVKIDLKKPPELEAQPNETKKQREERKKKEQEWLACYRGARFDYSYSSAMIDDIVQLIDEELERYLSDPVRYKSAHSQRRKIVLF